MKLDALIREKALELGADLVGFAPVERFKGAPLRMSPKGLMAESESVVVMAIHHPDAAVELGGEPTPHDIGPYNVQGAMNAKLDDISFLLARFLEDLGFHSLPIAASNIWRYYPYKDTPVCFAPEIAHRYAAVAAGLGEIGWSGLCLTPQFGPRQRFVSVITNAKLTPSPIYTGEALCDKCMECVNTCPTDAFRKEVKTINTIEIGGRTFTFPEINKWRCSWSENFLLNLAHDIPEKVDENVALEYLEKYGMRGGEEGCCLKFCMTPLLREYDKSYANAPRRKKVPSGNPDMLVDELLSLAKKRAVDILTVQSVASFKNKNITPTLHLPDAKSVICLRSDMPAPSPSIESISAVHRDLSLASYEIARFLDISGYSSITNTHISPELTAQSADIFRQNSEYSVILTSAELPEKIHKLSSIEKKTVSEEDVKNIAKETGADLAGIFTTKRFNQSASIITEAFKLPYTREVVEDKGLLYGPVIPKVHTEHFTLLSPTDRLPGAQSVIVIGMHFPDDSLDTAKVTPSETIGPYVFAKYETLLLLRHSALAVARLLRNAGYKADIFNDLTGFSSSDKTSRGKQPDMRSNLIPAILAGLAYPGYHGVPITPEFGIRQRFIAIVTDCPLKNDPLFTGPFECNECNMPCIKECPTHALSQSIKTFSLEGIEYPEPNINSFHCDWARRYGLSSKEGIATWGIESDREIPKEKSGEEIAKALSSVKWGIQKRHINTIEECIRTCPAGRKKRKRVPLKGSIPLQTSLPKEMIE